MKPIAFTPSPEYLEFIELFNRGEFFEAHEVLEGRWRKEKGEAREFYQGLIQVAAVFVHIRKGTPEGGRQLLGTARQYLEKYKPVFMGLDVAKLLGETENCLLAGSPLMKAPKLRLNLTSLRDKL